MEEVGGGIAAKKRKRRKEEPPKGGTLNFDSNHVEAVGGPEAALGAWEFPGALKLDAADQAADEGTVFELQAFVFLVGFVHPQIVPGAVEGRHRMGADPGFRLGMDDFQPGGLLHVRLDQAQNVGGLFQDGDFLDSGIGQRAADDAAEAQPGDQDVAPGAEHEDEMAGDLHRVIVHDEFPKAVMHCISEPEEAGPSAWRQGEGVGACFWPFNRERLFQAQLLDVPQSGFSFGDAVRVGGGEDLGFEGVHRLPRKGAEGAKEEPPKGGTPNSGLRFVTFAHFGGKAYIRAPQRAVARLTVTALPICFTCSSRVPLNL